jgi:excisionase family DNA binding protein
MGVLTDHTVLPPASAEGEELQALVGIINGGTELFLVTPDGHRFELGGELRNVLAHASKALSEGHAVTLEPHRAVLSTQEAADLLGVSRPTLVRLLESGEIAFTKPGRHRRVQLEDVLAYQQRIREHRGNELKAMSAEAAEDDAYRDINDFTETR